MQVDALVSTIIPVHNRAGLLREAVESVLAQTYRPIEIVIVDDGSTDETPRAIGALVAANPQIVLSLRIENAGPGAAREAGRQVAKGEFIQYLDSDDLLLPEKFARQVEALRAAPLCDVAYGMTRFYPLGDAPADRPWKRTGEAITSMFPLFLRERWWDTSTPLYRRSAVDRAGPWLTLRTEEDWEYDCRIARQGGRLTYCPVVVSDTRCHAGEMLSRPKPSLLSRSLADRAVAQQHIFEHARAAGIRAEAPEMRAFARSAFLLSRQCGAAGLKAESARLFELARSASPPTHRDKVQFSAYRLATRLIGWAAAGRLSCMLDKFRNLPA